MITSMSSVRVSRDMVHWHIGNSQSGHVQCINVPIQKRHGRKAPVKGQNGALLGSNRVVLRPTSGPLEGDAM